MLRAELYCYFCGHGMGEVLIPSGRLCPSVEQLRSAYTKMGREEQPVWDEREGGQPLCPRCNGQLFLERHEHEVVRRAERSFKKAS